MLANITSYVLSQWPGILSTVLTVIAAIWKVVTDRQRLAKVHHDEIETLQQKFANDMATKDADFRNQLATKETDHENAMVAAEDGYQKQLQLKDADTEQFKRRLEEKIKADQGGIDFFNKAADITIKLDQHGLTPGRVVKTANAILDLGERRMARLGVDSQKERQAIQSVLLVLVFEMVAKYTFDAAKTATDEKLRTDGLQLHSDIVGLLPQFRQEVDRHELSREYIDGIRCGATVAFGSAWGVSVVGFRHIVSKLFPGLSAKLFKADAAVDPDIGVLVGKFALFFATVDPETRTTGTDLSQRP